VGIPDREAQDYGTDDPAMMDDFGLDPRREHRDGHAGDARDHAAARGVLGSFIQYSAKMNSAVARTAESSPMRCITAS